MNYLIISKDHRYLYSYLEDNDLLSQIEKSRPGFATMKNGDTYRLVVRREDLRGRRPCKVIRYGPPLDWMFESETEALIKELELP